MDERGEIAPVDPDAPPGPSLGDEFWRDAQLVMPEAKTPISLRVDADVLDWFKAQGPGYQTRMNAVLKSYMAAQLRKAG
ncbi:BrnA antitoxin family protein [Aurantimonas sp. Leaf443]|uniref:BrnA antitoxin family protein n=1 Tax=Aurantimonas sp. Leaf443 TaxID=1736378 RepID=UPI000ABC3C0A|nr:BrnA antitoxin family protein [Aurantimonas sp. Leaf443]